MLQEYGGWLNGKKSLVKYCYFLEFDNSLRLAIDNVRLAYELVVGQNHEGNLLLLSATLKALNAVITDKKISIQMEKNVESMSNAQIFLDHEFNLKIEFALIPIYNAPAIYVDCNSPVRFFKKISLDELKTIRFISNKNLIANN